MISKSSHQSHRGP